MNKIIIGICLLCLSLVSYHKYKFIDNSYTPYHLSLDNKNSLKIKEYCYSETYINENSLELCLKKDIEINKNLFSCNYCEITEKKNSCDYIMCFLVLVKVLEIVVLILYLYFLRVFIHAIINFEKKMTMQDKLINITKKKTYKKDKKKTPFHAATAFNILNNIDISMLSDVDKIKLGIMKKGNALPLKKKIKKDINLPQKSSCHRLDDAIIEYHNKQTNNCDSINLCENEQTKDALALEHHKKLMKKSLNKIQQNMLLRLKTKESFNNEELKVVNSEEKLEIERINSNDLQTEQFEPEQKKTFWNILS